MRSSSPIETEYTIDYTTITTTKGTSPLHFLYPVMPSSSSSPTRTSSHHHRSPSSSSNPSYNPHSHSLNSSHHSPGGKRHARKKEREQQEIARLLDPSYQGGESHQTQGRRSLEVYVDKDGDLHDPDFRYFPSAEAFVSRTKRDTESRNRTTSPRRGEAMRPYWENNQNEYEEALADEEEEEELLAQELGGSDFLARAGYGNGTSSEYSPRSRSARSRRDGSFSSYARNYSGYSSGYAAYASPFNSHSASTTTTTTTSYYSPTMTTTTLPTSYESENTVLSSSAELEGEKEAGVKGLLAAAKRRRRLSKGEKEKKDEVKETRRSIEATRTSVLETTHEEDCDPQQQSHPHTIEATSEKVPVADDEEQREAEEAEDREFIQSHEDYVPTCTEGLKRHWLSISLRFRFGVYRAQRRFTRRAHSMF